MNKQLLLIIIIVNIYFPRVLGEIEDQQTIISDETDEEFQEYLELKKAYEERHHDEIQFEKKFEQQKINKAKEIREKLSNNYKDMVSSNKEEIMNEINQKYQIVLWGIEFPFYHNWLKQITELSKNKNGILLNSVLQNLLLKLGVNIREQSQIDFKKELLYPGYINYEITLPQHGKFLQQKFLFYVGIQQK